MTKADKYRPSRPLKQTPFWSEKEKQIVIENYLVLGTIITQEKLKDAGYERTKLAIKTKANRCLQKELKKPTPETVYDNIQGKRINPETGNIFHVGDSREEDDKFFLVYCSGSKSKGRKDRRMMGLQYEEWVTFERYLGFYLESRIERRAANLGLEFNLTIEYLLDIFPDDWICPAFNIKMSFGGGRKNINNTPSLDRVNSAKGYVQGNVQFICHRANSIKNNGTIEEHEGIVKYMKEYYY